MERDRKKKGIAPLLRCKLLLLLWEDKQVGEAKRGEVEGGEE